MARRLDYFEGIRQATHKKPVVLGLGYRARHGKDTACQMLIAERGNQYKIVRFGFADALKIEVNSEIECAGGVDAFFANTALPAEVVREDNPDMTDPLCPLGKFRTILQYWGVMRRETDPDYWTNQTAKAIKASACDLAIITDMRFLNEIKLVHDLGGFTARVQRVNYVSDVPLHISETCLDVLKDEEWDYRIDASNLEQLKEQALKVFDSIIKL